MQTQGLLVLNKPTGLRSTHCVDIVRRAMLAAGSDIKVGHGGTLDSSASGVLVLLTGRATRLSSLVMQMPKAYDVTVRLGEETTTCDYTGEVTAVGDRSRIHAHEVESILPSFLGWRMQVPPEISAVHVDGKRAHRIKRGGGVPVIGARPVFIRRIVMTSQPSPGGTFDLSISCGKGTYVRSIVRDMGRSLGCGAHVAALRRSEIGPFTLERAFEATRLSVVDDLRSLADEVIRFIAPLEEITAFLPSYTIHEDDARLLSGLPVPLSSASRRTFGRFCEENAVCVVSKRALTVARIEDHRGLLSLVPSVNILKDEVTA